MHPLARRALLLGLGLAACALSACTERAVIAGARAVFDSYQDALFAGDRDALRRVLSSESREVVDQIPCERARGKQRLRVVDAVFRSPEVILTVVDPNQGDRETRFVVVKERGELRLDLLASVAYSSEDVARPAGTPEFEPRELTEQELARIRSRYPAAFQ
jgi:hypothetical protein